MRCSTAYLYYDEEYLSSSCSPKLSSVTCRSLCKCWCETPGWAGSSLGVQESAPGIAVGAEGALRCLCVKQRPNTGAEDSNVSSMLLLQHSGCPPGSTKTSSRDRPAVSPGSPRGCPGSGGGSGDIQLLPCPQALLCLHPLSPKLLHEAAPCCPLCV